MSWPDQRRDEAVQPDCRIETILVTTDFSDTSERAFEPALMLARKFGAKIILAHVEEPELPYVDIENYSGSLSDVTRDLRVQKGDWLAHYAAEHFVPHVEVKIELLSGVPHVEIVRMADAWGADVIVMATLGRGVVSHALMGSTTERVLRRSTCPVMAVRD